LSAKLLRKSESEKAGDGRLNGLTTQPKKCGTNYKTRHNGVIGSLDLSHRNFTWKQKNPQTPHT